MPREWTRQQAIAAFNGIEDPHSAAAEAWIDRFAALGLITLVQPKAPSTPMEKLEHELRLCHFRDENMGTLKRSLENCGLEVVPIIRKTLR